MYSTFIITRDAQTYSCQKLPIRMLQVTNLFQPFPSCTGVCFPLCLLFNQLLTKHCAKVFFFLPGPFLPLLSLQCFFLSVWSLPKVDLCYWKVTAPPPAVMDTKIQPLLREVLSVCRLSRLWKELSLVHSHSQNQIFERLNMLSLLL